MLRRIFQAFAGSEPLRQSASYFGEMLELVQGMVVEANAVYWGKVQSDRERADLERRDAQVNRLQRDTRREVIASLTADAPVDVPHGLLLMSLVKDIERLGDYAKNLASIPALTHDNVAERVLPECEITSELRDISHSIMALAAESQRVYSDCNKQRAEELTIAGRANAQRCQELMRAISRSDFRSEIAVDLALAVRFYKRIQGHYLSLLSGVVMPLDQLDQYADEQGD